MDDQMYKPEQPIGEITSDFILKLLKEYDVLYRSNLNPNSKDKDDEKVLYYSRSKRDELRKILELFNQNNNLSKIEGSAQDDLNNGTLVSIPTENNPQNREFYSYTKDVEVEQFQQPSEDNIENLIKSYASSFTQSLSLNDREDILYNRNLAIKSVLKDVLKQLNQMNKVDNIEKELSGLHMKTSISQARTEREGEENTQTKSLTFYARSIVAASKELVEYLQSEDKAISDEEIIASLIQLEMLVDQSRVMVNQRNTNDFLTEENNDLRKKIKDSIDKSNREELKNSLMKLATRLQNDWGMGN